MDGTIFGYTEEQIMSVGVPILMTALMLYMCFIIWNLAKESKAGRFGTFVLFFGLGFGMLGFVAKSIIQKIWGI